MTRIVTAISAQTVYGDARRRGAARIQPHQPLLLGAPRDGKGVGTDAVRCRLHHAQCSRCGHCGIKGVPAFQYRPDTCRRGLEQLTITSFA